MERYEQNAFISFVLFCGVVLLVSCNATRHTDTITDVAARDTTRTSIRIDTIAAALGRCAELRDTIRQTDRVTGTLKIERDTAGRPVLFIWDTSALTQASQWQKWNCDTRFEVHAAAHGSDTSSTRAEDIQKEETRTARVGPTPEAYFGAAVLLFAILYVIYVILENLWLKRNK